MFDDPETPILRMIQRAVKVYKRLYSEYPETVGLDIFTRFREWGQTPFVERYYWRELESMPVDVFADPTNYDLSIATITYTNVSVKVEAATFGGYHRFPPRPIDPSRGRDEVWCKRGEHEVSMHLLFSERGYCATIWEKSDLTNRDE